MNKNSKYKLEPHRKVNVGELAADRDFQKLSPGHFFTFTAGPLMVADNWPLRGYYVYVDWDLGGLVEFDTSPLWTDENGYLHTTNSDGTIGKRLTCLPFAWSHRRGATSCVLIYDRDRAVLDSKRQKVLSLSKHHKEIPKEYRLSFWNNGAVLVPKPDGFLNEMRELMKTCDEKVDAVRQAVKDVEDFVNKDDYNKTLIYGRDRIHQWLERHPDARARLVRTPKLISWEAECAHYDRMYTSYGEKLKDKQEQLYQFLLNADVRRKIGLIDVVVDELAEDGYHLLWREQFLAEAWGLLADSPRFREVFESDVRPVFEALSTAFHPCRAACECPTCRPLGEQLKGSPQSEGARSPTVLLGDKGWDVLTDIKLGFKTIKLHIDLVTKFRSAFAELIVSGSYAVVDHTYGVKSFGDRIAHLVGRYSYKGFSSIVDGVDRYTRAAIDVADSAEQAGKGLKDALSAADDKILQKLGDGLAALGGTIAVLQWLSSEKKLDVKKLGGAAKGALDIGELGTKYLLPAKLLKQYKIDSALAGKGEQELAEVARNNALKCAKWVKVAGSAVSVTVSAYGLHSAADTGTNREFFWAAVVYTGDSIFLIGAAMDATGVAAPVGVVLNVIGGVVSVAGTFGEIFSKPDPEEEFLLKYDFLTPKQTHLDSLIGVPQY